MKNEITESTQRFECALRTHVIPFLALFILQLASRTLLLQGYMISQKEKVKPQKCFLLLGVEPCSWTARIFLRTSSMLSTNSHRFIKYRRKYLSEIRFQKILFTINWVQELRAPIFPVV